MKKAQVVWSAESLADLEIIYDFLAEKSKTVAQQVVSDLLNRTEQLETFPESGAIQQSLMSNTKVYRYLVEGNYKILYSYNPQNHHVYIEIIFDTRNNPEKLKI